MAIRPINSSLDSEAKAKTKKRSALGVGVTTLVTIMVVLLMAAFAVLSLVSARSNLGLSQIASTQGQRYYAADSEATVWYAELDTLVATLQGTPGEFENQLSQAGYEPETTSNGELRISKGFSINESQTLMVTIQINDDRTTTIRQWQS